MQLLKLKEFYINHLFNNLIDFWLKNGIDHENGAFFTCFNNTGAILIAKDKYIWSQGRFLWMLSHLYRSFYDYMDAEMIVKIRTASERGAVFLKEHALLADYKCAWVVDKEGNPLIADKEREEYDLGVEADYFLVYGMAEFARAFNKIEYFDLALKIFNSINNRIESGNYKTAPQGKPEGYKVHGKGMIMLETSQELAEAAKYFNKPFIYKKLMKIAETSINSTINNFVKEDMQMVVEMIKVNDEIAEDELLGSFFNPGHSLEDAWFMMHYACKSGSSFYMQKALNIVKWMTVKGWDKEYGGIPEFLHISGGKPRGRVKKENKNGYMVQELDTNWDKKLWWVHSEALYSLICAYEHSNDDWYMEIYWKYHEYVFKTFPNSNNKIGEWIQIRDRKGDPADAVVALPVKDPYHITRAFMHIIQSLDRMTS